jgi:uncharacterized protein with HEPN domain
VIVHEYHSLGVDRLWTSAKHDVPRLVEELAAVQVAEEDR